MEAIIDFTGSHTTLANGFCLGGGLNCDNLRGIEKEKFIEKDYLKLLNIIEKQINKRFN
jgi:hypothetical protein